MWAGRATRPSTGRTNTPSSTAISQPSLSNTTCAPESRIGTRFLKKRVPACSLVRKPPHPHVEDESKRGERRHERRPAIAHEGQGQSLDGSQPGRHRDVVHHLEGETRNDSDHETGADPVFCQLRGVETPHQDEEIQAESHKNPKKSMFLGPNRIDEVVVRDRKKAVAPLGPLPEPLPHQAAGTDGDLRLDLLKPLATGVFRRVDEGL